MKSIVEASNLAGVPVLSLPSWKPACLREAERPVEGEAASCILPAGKLFKPESNCEYEVIEVKLWAYLCGFHQLEKCLCR